MSHFNSKIDKILVELEPDGRVPEWNVTPVTLMFQTFFKFVLIFVLAEENYFEFFILQLFIERLEF